MSIEQRKPTIQQYWVVGGKYETLAFDHIVQGTESVFGPFASIEDAEGAWRRVTETTRSQASFRYTIAAEPTRALQMS
jgi:hypothetical protein